MGIFSRRQIDDIFLIFPRKQDLTFHEETFCMKCHPVFREKYEKYFKMLPAEDFTQSLSVKVDSFLEVRQKQF